MSEPCKPHKQTGVSCGDCTHYDPVAERILIVKLGAMGDVLRTTTCLPALKAHHPRSHVTWITRRNAIPLLAGNTSIDRILSIDTNYLELLMVERFDLVFCPDADPLSASIAALPRTEARRGYVADGRGGVIPLNDAAEGWWRTGLDDGMKRANRRTYGEWLYAMCDLPTPVARPSLRIPAEVAARAVERLRGLGPGVARWACFNTGGSRRWEEKRWKQAHYVELARALAAADPGTGILLVGGPEEAAFNRELLLKDRAFVDGGCDNAVADFAALIAACAWTLTGDSLGYHIACAVGTPALCLVGPTAPWELDTYGESCVLHAPLQCIACYLPKCPLSTTCMDMLTPGVVWDAIADWQSRLLRPRRAVA